MRGLTVDDVDLNAQRTPTSTCEFDEALGMVDLPAVLAQVGPACSGPP
jgi:hypothetical protein